MSPPNDRGQGGWEEGGARTWRPIIRACRARRWSESMSLATADLAETAQEIRWRWRWGGQDPLDGSSRGPLTDPSVLM